MITGRRSTDWLRDASVPERGAGDRRADDRRSADRRAPRRRIDPIFAATLINQVAPAAEPLSGYPADKTARRGVLINLRA